MKMQTIPKYEWGQRIIASVKLYNDGSYPERDANTLLVEKGAPGEIVKVGVHTELDVAIYLVAFPGEIIVGCLEEEIVPA